MKPTTAPAVSPEQRALLTEWQKASEWIKEAVKSEMELRKKIFAQFFPKPSEGTNTFLADGVQIKAVHKINRSLDKAALDSVMPQLQEQWRILGTLISYEPKFSTEVYRTMPDDQKKIFEQALSIADGAPTLEVIVSEVIATGTATKEQAHAAGLAAAGRVATTPAATTPAAKPAGKKPTTRKKK